MDGPSVQYWELHVKTVKLSRSSDGSFGISIEGGSDKGQFGYVGCVKDTVIIAEGDIATRDIILQVNGDAVGGFIHWDLLCEIRRSGSLLTLLVIGPDRGLPTALRDFLSATYDEHTEDFKLQKVVRHNLYNKSLPCTTRLPRPDEKPGLDYLFVTEEEFNDMDTRGLLLEKGLYGGHMYGTPQPDPYDPNMHTTYNGTGRQLGPRQLGKLPPGWEVTYNQQGQKYFINHNDGTTTWMDPRLVALQYHSAKNSRYGELPYGWEEVTSDKLGVYYIDYINKRTSLQHPNAVQQGAYNQPAQYNQDQPMLSGYGSPIQLPGHIITATLYKTTKGFGFTLFGGDKSGQPVLIKSVKQGSPAQTQGRLMAGDILVRVNGHHISSLSHSQVVQIFKMLPNGAEVHLELRRNIPENLPHPGPQHLHPGAHNGPHPGSHHGSHPGSLPSYNSNGQKSYDGADSCSSRSAGSLNGHADLIPVYIDKGENGFGFTIHQSTSGQRIKSIMDRSRCCHLIEGDLIVQLNGERLQYKTHAETVSLLKSIPPLTRTLFLINRSDVELKRKDRKNMSFRTRNPPDTSMYPINQPSSNHVVNVNPLTQPRLPLTLQHPQQIDSNRMSDHSGSIGDPNRHFSGSDRQPNLSGSDRQHNLSGSDRQQPPPLNWCSSEDINVMLQRDNDGFGFRIIGGEEQGTPVAIGMVTPEGPADCKLHVYDEIRTINGQNVLGAYHNTVIELIGQAAAYTGKVSMLVRRYKNPEQALNMSGLQLPELETARYRLVDIRNITITKTLEECFGFVIHSSLKDDTFKIGQIVADSPAGRCTDLLAGDSVLAVEGTPITGLQHRTVVELIKECTTSVQLGVGTPQIIQDDDWVDETEEVDITIERDEKGFGFSIRGGKAFQEDTLFVLRIGKGGVADRDGRLRRGDEIVEINGQSMKEVCHQDAVDKIKSGGSVLNLVVRRRKLDIPPIIQLGLQERPDSLTYPQRTEIKITDNSVTKPDTLEKDDTIVPNNKVSHEYDKYDPQGDSNETAPTIEAD